MLEQNHKTKQYHDDQCELFVKVNVDNQRMQNVWHFYFTSKYSLQITIVVHCLIFCNQLYYYRF